MAKGSPVRRGRTFRGELMAGAKALGLESTLCVGGGLCGWSRGSKGESTRRGGESRGGKSRRLLWESLGDSRFTPVSWKARVDAEQWRK